MLLRHLKLADDKCHPPFRPDTKEEDLNHPEDIEHFKKHEEDAMARERQEKLDAMPIVEQNIPAKFRRNS